MLVIAGGEIERAYATLTEGSIRMDPARIAAGIVTGIGFLGAGAIMRAADAIHGLTTASCVWLVAALGIACGAGYPLLATLTTAIALATLIGLQLIERFIEADRHHMLRVATGEEETHDRIRAVLEGKGAQVQRCELRTERIEAGGGPSLFEIVYHVRHKGDIGRETVSEVCRIDGVRNVTWEFER